MVLSSRCKSLLGVLAVFAGILLGSVNTKPVLAVDQVYVEKREKAGTFGNDGSGYNNSYYYYVDGALMLCGDAEYGGFTAYRPYTEYNDDVAKAIVLVAAGIAPGYTIGLDSYNYPRTNEYAMLHSILSIHLHYYAPLMASGEQIGWIGQPAKVSAIYNEANNIYNWVRANYPDKLSGYTLYRTPAGYTGPSGPLQQIYFVKQSSVDVSFDSSSTVKNSEGTSVENRTFKVKDSELDSSTMIARTTLTFSHYITPSSYGANNGQYTRIRTTIDGVDAGTKSASGTSNTNTVDVTLNLGEVKKICQYAYFSPSSITMSTTGALLSSDSTERYSSACTSVSADLDADTTSFASTTRVYDIDGADKTDDSDNIYTLASGVRDTRITFRSSIDPRSFGASNAHYYKIVTLDNGREIAAHTKALGGTELDYTDEISVHVGSEEKHKVCQYIYFSPINVTSLAGKVISSTPSTTKNSYACMYLVSSDKAEYDVGTDVD